MPNVNPIPEGRHNVTPYLIIKGAAKAIDFYKQVFGAQEVMRMGGDGGDKIGHAEIKIGDSHIMMADEHPNMGAVSPQTLGGSSTSLMVYVENVDAVVEKAVAAGAKLERPVANQFYGDRSGTFSDPWGHRWTVSTHIEDVPMEEINRRAAEMAKQQVGKA